MTPRNVTLFVFDTLADWEPAYAIAGINDPVWQSNPSRFRVRTAAIARAPVTTVGGVRIEPDITLDELQPAAGDLLILPGGHAWDQGRNLEAVAPAQAMLAAGGAVAAICGATLGLAKGGLLDTRQHTSNAREYLAPTGYRGAAFYREAPAVLDDRVITAPATASLDFARLIFQFLELYPADVLEAWYQLFRTGDPKYFAALMKSQG